MRNLPLIKTVIYLPILLIFVSSCEKDSTPTDGPPKGSSHTSVGAMVVRSSTFTESITITGTVNSNEAIEVQGELGGRVVAIGFSEGTRVSAGQVLVQVDDAELVARRKKLQRQLELDEERVSRFSGLRNVDGISADDFSMLEAQRDVRQAEIAELDVLIERAKVRAPFTGIAGLRRISPGSVITPSTVITTLHDNATLKIDFTVPERYATHVSSGQRIKLRSRDQAESDSSYAIVYAVEPGLDASTRTLTVRARIASTKGFLPGMFADIDLTLSPIKDALMIPTESITPDAMGAKVFTIKNGIALESRVTIGGRTPTHAFITSGLQEGDTLVTKGLLMVRKGMPVDATMEEFPDR